MPKFSVEQIETLLEGLSLNAKSMSILERLKESEEYAELDPELQAKISAAIAEPVAAAATPVIRPRREINRPPDAAPKEDKPKTSLPSILTAGGATTTREAALEALHDQMKTMVNRRPGAVKVLRFPGPQLALSASDDPAENAKLMATAFEESQKAAASGQALTAALCAPAMPVYEHFQVSTATAGVWEIPAMSAPRGSVEIPVSPGFEDAEGRVFTFDPDDPVTKTTWEPGCDDFVKFQIRAFGVPLRFSNFDSQFFGERVEAYLKASMDASAQVANAALIAEAVALAQGPFGSPGDGGGVVAALTRAVSLSVSWYKQRHRIPPETFVDVLLPVEVAALAQADYAARRSTTKIGPSIQGLRDELGSLGARIKFVYGYQEQLTSPEPAASYSFLIYPSGGLVRLDGGSIDTGISRSSALNEANKFEILTEIMTAVAQQGPLPVEITDLVLCASGQVGPVDEALAWCGVS